MSKKPGSSKANKRSFFSALFHSEDKPVSPKVPGHLFPLLDLPQSVRVQIWRLLGFSHTATLRLVCAQIKEDIDTAAGISSAIDSTFDDFSFHSEIAIRKVAIHELVVPSYVPFLKYPLVLREVEIRGEISVQNFQYIIKSCPNIVKLIIFFNKFVLDQQSPMFPLPEGIASQQPRPLSNLCSLKLIANTKKIVELFYVYRNVISLLRDSLGEAKVSTIHIWMTHKVPSMFFREIMLTTLVFVHKNARYLRYVNLTFRDKDTTSAEETVKTEDGQQPTNQYAPSSQTASNSNSEPQQIARRDTGLPDIIVSHHNKDLHGETEGAGEGEETKTEGEDEANVEPTAASTNNAEETNDGITDTIKYLEQNPWQKAPLLEQLVLIAPFKTMQHLSNLISGTAKLKTLHLEALGVAQNTWPLYEEFVTKMNLQELKYAAFHSVNHVDILGRALPLDLSVFKKCAKLRKLSIMSQKKDDFLHLSKVLHLSQLPKSLQDVCFERVLLTPSQVLRLAFCYTKMETISLSYWSINEFQFSLVMALLKWLVSWDLTEVHRIVLVDTKIRFTNKRKAVRKLQEAVAISTKYQDAEETKLIIDQTNKQDNASFAPRISVIIVTAPQPKPKRGDAGGGGADGGGGRNAKIYRSNSGLASGGSTHS